MANLKMIWHENVHEIVPHYSDAKWSVWRYRDMLMRTATGSKHDKTLCFHKLQINSLTIKISSQGVAFIDNILMKHDYKMS